MVIGTGPVAWSGPRPTVRALGARSLGSMPPAVIDRIARQRFGVLLLCYERLLLVEPTAKGRAVVQFDMQPDGSIANIHVEPSSTPSNASFHACLASAFEHTTWPTPEGNQPEHVVFPILFDPKPPPPSKYKRDPSSFD